jgi:hypothetical protein
MASTFEKNLAVFLGVIAGRHQHASARKRIKGLRPHHLPRRVSVCPLLALRYL